MANSEITFTWRGALAGTRACLPIALGAGVYGIVFGILARQTGLSLAEAMLMSTIVFAGASQLVALGLWVTPLPTGALILTTLIVNLRHLLMGASLYPWLSRLPSGRVYASLFFMTDESWALTLGALNDGMGDGAFLLGSGLTVFIFWGAATALGELVSGLVSNPAQWGLDFAFTAVFLALLVGLWRGKADLLPWIVAAGVAVAAQHWLPGKWYILLGGLAGSLIGALRRGD
jgi:branched chain amino acid efflux pump